MQMYMYICMDMGIYIYIYVYLCQYMFTNYIFVNIYVYIYICVIAINIRLSHNNNWIKNIICSKTGCQCERAHAKIRVLSENVFSHSKPLILRNLIWFQQCHDHMVSKHCVHFFHFSQLAGNVVILSFWWKLLLPKGGCLWKKIRRFVHENIRFNFCRIAICFGWTFFLFQPHGNQLCLVVFVFFLKMDGHPQRSWWDKNKSKFCDDAIPRAIMVVPQTHVFLTIV